MNKRVSSRYFSGKVADVMNGVSNILQFWRTFIIILTPILLSPLLSEIGTSEAKYEYYQHKQMIKGFFTGFESITGTSIITVIIIIFFEISQSLKFSFILICLRISFSLCKNKHNLTILMMITINNYDNC